MNALAHDLQLLFYQLGTALILLGVSFVGLALVLRGLMRKTAYRIHNTGFQSIYIGALFLTSHLALNWAHGRAAPAWVLLAAFAVLTLPLLRYFLRPLYKKSVIDGLYSSLLAIIIIGLVAFFGARYAGLF